MEVCKHCGHQPAPECQERHNRTPGVGASADRPAEIESQHGSLRNQSALPICHVPRPDSDKRETPRTFSTAPVQNSKRQTVAAGERAALPRRDLAFVPSTCLAAGNCQLL